MIIALSLCLFSSLALSQGLKDQLHRQTAQKHRSYSYSEARKILMNEVHLEKDQRGYFISGVYCLKNHYPFGGAHPGNRLPNHTVFNTEHTWPQSKFTRRFPKHVQKSDLHHLYPTFSRINSERGNLPFAEVQSSRSLSCQESQSGAAMSTGGGHYFEPPHDHKGNVARAMFYFSIRYKTNIDPVQENYLRRWHDEDPVDQTERRRNDLIAERQRNRNPFIDSPELVDQIDDF